MEEQRILAVGYRLDRLMPRAARLRKAGYVVDMASAEAQAEFLVRQNRYAAAVLGAAIPEEVRNRLALSLINLNPQCAIIMLYEVSIRNAELADAVLNYETAEQNLPETIRHLLSQRMHEKSKKAAQ